MGNEDPPTAGGDGWHNIRFQRISDHGGPVWPIPMPVKNALVGLRVFVADNFNSMEEFSQAGLGQFALLVEKIALGDQDKPICPAQVCQGFPDMGQRQDGMRQHFAASTKNFLNNRGRDLAIGYVNGRFDHRQDKALGAEAIELQISFFGLQQACAQIGTFRIFCEKLHKAGFRELEEMLALPQRVIGIQSDSGKRGHLSDIQTSAGASIIDTPSAYTSSLMFNYRYSKMTYGFVARQLKPLPEGSVLEASFDLPDTERKLVIAKPAKAGQLQNSFETESLRGVQKDTPYKVQLKLLEAVTGRELAVVGQVFKSDVDQDTLPTKAPVVGIGYQTAPE